MGVKMMIFLVILGMIAIISLCVIAILEARRMDKDKPSLLSSYQKEQKSHQQEKNKEGKS